MNSEAIYTKGGCTQCGGHIEFPREALGAQVACPHCSASTTLLENLPAPATPAALATPVSSPPPTPGESVQSRSPKPGQKPTRTANGQPAEKSFSRECPGCGLEVSIRAAACPACRAVLRERKGISLKLLIPIVVMAIGAGGFFAIKTGKLRLPQFGESAPADPAKPGKPAPPPKPVKRTGKFEVVEHKVEKTPGTSLIYVVGSVLNDTDKQKFSVRVTFALSAKGGKSAGEATDYITVIEQGDTWNFRALILDSAAEEAKLTSLEAENP